ncbi:MAG TPA: NIPSNAP family protein [Crinalium sp.]
MLMVDRVRGIKGMIYELRIYHAMPGQLPALMSRFQNHTLRIWEKHGIRQAGFWTTLIGQSESNQLTYLLAWNSLAEREERWSAFLADPEWIAIKTETEKDAPLVQNSSNELLAPTAFSSVR